MSRPLDDRHGLRADLGRRRLRRRGTVRQWLGASRRAVSECVRRFGGSGQLRLPSGVSADRAGERGTWPSSANLNTAGRVPCFPWSGLHVGPRAPRDRHRKLGLGRRPLARAQAAPAAATGTAVPEPAQAPAAGARVSPACPVSNWPPAGDLAVQVPCGRLPERLRPLGHKDGRHGDTRRPRGRGRGGPRTNRRKRPSWSLPGFCQCRRLTDSI